jgi:hypothetical protein
VAARVYLVPVSPKGVTINDSGSGRHAMRKLEYVGCREAGLACLQLIRLIGSSCGSSSANMLSMSGDLFL